MATKKNDGDRQTEVPESDGDRVNELEALGREFRNRDQDWQNAGKERKDAHDKLLAGMRAHRRRQYRLKTGELAKVVDTEKVRLERAREE